MNRRWYSTNPILRETLDLDRGWEMFNLPWRKEDCLRQTEKQSSLTKGGRAFVGMSLVLAVTGNDVMSAVSSIPNSPVIVSERPSSTSASGITDAMLRLAGVRATDFIIGLGTDDGGIVVAAAQSLGARGFGVLQDSARVRIAEERARKAKVGDRIRFIQEDMGRVELASATVVSVEFQGELRPEIRQKLFLLKPGTRIVSRGGRLGAWESDARMLVSAQNSGGGQAPSENIYLWLVPAKIDGVWESWLRLDGRWINAKLSFSQEFQKVTGELVAGNHHLPMERVSLTGDFLSFRIQDGDRTVLFTGHVQNGRIVGQTSRPEEGVQRWRALREQR
jgi:hypothetical protein